VAGAIFREENVRTIALETDCKSARSATLPTPVCDGCETLRAYHAPSRKEVPSGAGLLDQERAPASGNHLTGRSGVAAVTMRDAQQPFAGEPSGLLIW
jgi:hypothetical protein